MPAGDEASWTSPAFEATERGGAIYGRGAADSKGNILVHVGALKAWNGRPPVGIKLLIEGQEEVGSPLEDGYPAANPEPFRADAILVAVWVDPDGQPSLTVSLRGDARLTVEVRTLAGNKHSGQYGGAAPDALAVFLTALASLWDARGDVAVEGLRREEWTGEAYTDEEDSAGSPRLKTTCRSWVAGGSGRRSWSGPGITVLGIDCPAVDGAAASVQSHARWTTSLSSSQVRSRTRSTTCSRWFSRRRRPRPVRARQRALAGLGPD